MARAETSKADITRETDFLEEFDARVSSEMKILRRQFSNLGPKRKKILDGLIWRAAFMRVQLQELEKDLEAFGITERFSQSENAEPYDRERPQARVYNAMLKNYLAVIRELNAYVAELPPTPKTARDKEADEFKKFIQQRNEEDD